MFSLVWGGVGDRVLVMLGYFDVCVCVCFVFELYWCFSALVCSRLYLVICVLFSYIFFPVLGLF